MGGGDRILDASINCVTLNTAQTPGNIAAVLSSVPEEGFLKIIDAVLDSRNNPTSQSESFDEFFALLGKD